MQRTVQRLARAPLWPAAGLAGAAAWHHRDAEAEARSGLTIRELKEGTGDLAAPGSWASIHYVVKLLGDGTIVEDTTSSGWGSRDYGQPFQFCVGEIENKEVLRALHPCVLDMRVGGKRRVRLCIGDPDFGYHQKPELMDPRKWGLKRDIANDWLLDVEVTLVAVDKARAKRWW